MITVWHNASFPNAIKRRVSLGGCNYWKKGEAKRIARPLIIRGRLRKKERKKGKREERRKEREREKGERISFERKRRRRILVATYISTRSSRDDVWTKGNRIKSCENSNRSERREIISGGERE